MALFSDPFDVLLSLQQAFDTVRESGWLDSGPSSSGAYPPINVFRKDDDFVIIAEVPGINKSSITVEVKGRTIRIAGTKTVQYPDSASLHRKERLEGRFDRAITLPIDIDAEHIQAECHDGILALLLPQAAHEKPKAIQIH